MREKLRAAGIHLLVGLVLISLVFCLVYFVRNKEAGDNADDEPKELLHDFSR